VQEGGQGLAQVHVLLNEAEQIVANAHRAFSSTKFLRFAQLIFSALISRQESGRSFRPSRIRPVARSDAISAQRFSSCASVNHAPALMAGPPSPRARGPTAAAP